MAVTASPESLPAYLAPMLATLGTLPPAGQDRDWAYEMKWDGMRAIVRLDGGRVSVHSRNDRDVTVSFPELAALGERLPDERLMLDGELVCFDADGRPNFGLLQDRMHVSSPAQAARLSRDRPVVLLAFDLLHQGGQSLRALPYAERRRRLAELRLDGTSWRTPPVFDGAGSEALRTSRELGLEGVVAKRLRSAYRPGARSRDWVKVKNLRTQEVVIGGWTPGQGRRDGTIGALLLGLPEPAGRPEPATLRYVGKVGTGFTRRMLDELLPRLRSAERPDAPFAPAVPRADSRDAHWVRPELVGEVAYAEWTGDGRLRHPAWRGLRPDKSPAEVVREQ